MKKPVKRNKKYNPNKLQHQALSRTVAERKKWQSLDVLYEFEMEFVVEKVNKIINDFAEQHGLAEDEYTPAHVVVGAYEEQDLIIALKQQLINVPESWEIGIDSHFYNLDTDQVHTIPFALNLPPMTHFELMNGCAAKVVLVDGIKTVQGEWKGLQAEMIKNWEKQGIPDGFDLIQSQVKIKAFAHFKDMDRYDRFNGYLAARDNGTLIHLLKNEDMIADAIDTQLKFIGKAV